MTLDALKAALDEHDDTKIDEAVDALKEHAVLHIEGIDLVIATYQERGPPHVVTSFSYRLADALERAAAAEQPSLTQASAYAVRAALLQRDTLNDGEGTTRTLTLALMLAADDPQALRDATAAAGGPEPATALLEKAAKRSKGDDVRIGRLRHALARLCEVVVRDVERAFFESLKAARKLHSDSTHGALAVDEVYRLGMETKRTDEAIAFFQSLGDDDAVTPRMRATAFNKLGALLEHNNDDLGAYTAFVSSLRHHETKAARKKAERLRDKLEIATPLPEPVDAASLAPVSVAPVSVAPVSLAPVSVAPVEVPVTAPVPVVEDDTAAHEIKKVAASADTVMRAERPVDIVVVPPPLHEAPPDDEVSVRVTRDDLTIERPPEPPTMTMPPETPIGSASHDDGPMPPAFGAAGKKKKRKRKKSGHSAALVETTTPSGDLSASGLDLTIESEASASLEAPATAAPPPLSELSLPVEPPVEQPSPPTPLPEGEGGRIFEPAVTAPGAQAEPLFVPKTPVPAAGPSPRDVIVARATELLAQTRVTDDDLVEFLTCAEELSAVVPGDPRVLRLAGRALIAAAPSGDLPTSGLDLVMQEAPRHGDRAAAIIKDIQAALPADTRRAYAQLWLTGARAAGHDTDTTHDLLQEVASYDGPSGPMFTLLDAVLRDAGDVDRRDALHLRAWRACDDENGKIAILLARIDFLESAKRDAALLQAWPQLVLEHHTDEQTRRNAMRFVEQKGTPDERARFLARLARKTDGDEAIAVLRDLLGVRVSVDDRVGAEASARDLLARAPGDAQAVTVLSDLLADDPRRTEELVDVLIARRDAASVARDKAGTRDALERLARAYSALGRADDAASSLVAAARLDPGDLALTQRVTETLLDADQIAPAVDLLDELADDAPQAAAGRLWLRAAELAKERLRRLGRARELIEKAIAADDHNVEALDAHAQLLLELGDAQGALSSLERLSTLYRDGAKDGPVRGRVHLRAGKVLEENLQRDDDAARRYRAALEADRTLSAAWEGLYGIARRRGDRDVTVEALTGLAHLESPRGRASTLVKLGKVYESEPRDDLAAATAYETALNADPSNLEALQNLVAVRARILHSDADLDAALAVPSPELVDEIGPFLRQSEQAIGTTALPFAFRRVLALAVTQDGDADDARQRFESLLEERGDDLPTLLAFARHLAHTARQPLTPGQAAAADARRREVLETVLLHHAYALKPSVHLDVWGEVAALRLQEGDLAGAKKAAKKALALVAAADPRAEIDNVLSDRAVRSFVLALDVLTPEGGLHKDAESSDTEQLELALRLDLQRAIAPSEKAKLKETQAKVAIAVRNDTAAARQLLREALQHDPDLSTARETLFDLELSGEDPHTVLERSRALLATERDTQKKAQLHLKLFRLHKKLKGDDVASAEIRAAIEADPKNIEITETAEKHFADQNDLRGLDELYTARLKATDRGDVVGRTALLERIALLRRYELRDLRGAIDACEAQSALLPEAIKPREDAARMHVELGQWKEAIAAWRAVLERDTLAGEAWRGLFSILARTRQGDEAFAIGASMAALELADDDIARAVRAVRPPFPRWPVPPADQTSLKKKLSHPLERTCVRAVLEVTAQRLLPRLGRPLADFGVRRSAAIHEAKLPASVAMAVRTAASLIGVRVIPVYQADNSDDDDVPPFAALPASEPALLITADVLRGGMTPERAFALGRAAAWLSPWAVLAASLDAADIRRLLEGLVAAFVSPNDVERSSIDVERYGKQLRVELLQGLGPTDADALTQALLPALRDWVVQRQRLQLADWKAGVGYTGDRIGFLLAGELPAAVKIIRASGASLMSMRTALRELVLFSTSQPYLQLRRELALALPEQATAPILDLG